ncbi:MAG: hypothetical protein ACRELC_10520, partial [Gemmatimonadota bacterium]
THPWRAALHRWLAALAGALVAIYLILGFLNLLGGGTPAPPSRITDPTAVDQRQAILQYAGSLVFDSTTHAAGDVQVLSLVDTTAQVEGVAPPVARPIGPLASIYPEENAHRNSLHDLLAGRIVARIWVDEPGYTKLGLRPGVNWVWIDSIAPPDTASAPPIPRQQVERPVSPPLRGQEPGQLIRAVIIPDDETSPVTIRNVRLSRQEHGVVNVPLARWLYRSDDDDVWQNCTRYYCCCVGICVN